MERLRQELAQHEDHILTSSDQLAQQFRQHAVQVQTPNISFNHLHPNTSVPRAVVLWHILTTELSCLPISLKTNPLLSQALAEGPEVLRDGLNTSQHLSHSILEEQSSSRLAAARPPPIYQVAHNMWVNNVLS